MKKYARLRRFYRTWKGLIKLGILLLLILMLCASCTKNTAGTDFCLLYKPIYADYENDTAQTIEQIDSNNIVYEQLCQ